MKQASARRGLLIYFLVLIAGSTFLELKIVRLGAPVSAMPWMIAALMYVPAIASIVARLSLREGFGDVSFLWGGDPGTRAAIIAWIFPVFVGFLAYGAAWAAGLAEFQRPLPSSSHLYTHNAAANLFASFVVTATLGTLLSCVTAFGEELGWRGYMQTRLVEAGVPKPVLVGGVIWAAWHLPLLLSGQYAAGTYPILSGALFTIGTVAMAYLAAYVRFMSGSLWPSVILHAAWNAIIQGTFDRATMDAPLAVGESGWLTMIISVVLVSWLTRGHWTILRRPGEPLPSSLQGALMSRYL